MNEREILNSYQKQNDRFCLSQILNKIEFCQNQNNIQNTDFLDMYQISLVKNFLKKIKYEKFALWGGYEEAERQILILFPKEKEIPTELLKIVRITLSEKKKENFTHRNYLGAIIKLGLKREKVGDILVDPKGADIIVENEFSNILEKELSNLTRFEGSNIEIIKIENLRKLEIQKEEIKIIVSSLRLDNIVADLARTSRSKASEIIKQERVFINGQNETKVSKQIKMKDIITIRGKGRFIIKETNGTTRSGRPVLLIEKYK